MRDIYTIKWIIKFANNINFNFLNIAEKNILQTGLDFLNKTRFVLQFVAGNENRLLFNHQLKIAKLLNYKNDKNSSN